MLAVTSAFYENTVLVLFLHENIYFGYGKCPKISNTLFHTFLA